MHKEGHIGIGLIIYSFFTVIFLLLDMINTALIFGIIFIFLSYHPDIDLKIQRKTSFLRNKYLKAVIPFLSNLLNATKHRKITHTIWYALLWGLIISSFSFIYFSNYETLPRMILSITGFIIGFLGIISHLLGDILTPMGIKPFYPVKNKNYTLDKVKAKNKYANFSFLFLGIIINIIVIYVLG